MGRSRKLNRTEWVTVNHIPSVVCVSESTLRTSNPTIVGKKVRQIMRLRVREDQTSECGRDDVDYKSMGEKIGITAR